MTRLGAFSFPVVAIVASGMLLTVAGCGQKESKVDGPVLASPVKASVEKPTSAAAAENSKGMAALQQAAQSGKYLFTFFFKAEDEQTLALRKVFDTAMEKRADRAQTLAINITDASEKAIVDKFDLSRAPMPLVLAIAPNGAITGGFPGKFEEQQLLDAFATPGIEQAMKSLQEGKLVFVCFQNAKTKSNDAAMQGVNAFKADERFGHATAIVTLDPADKKEVSFLADLQVSPETNEAVTVFLAPPGRAVSKYEGETQKDTLVDALGKANTSCGPNGCGPNGCGPKP